MVRFSIREVPGSNHHQRFSGLCLFVPFSQSIHWHCSRGVMKSDSETSFPLLNSSVIRSLCLPFDAEVLNDTKTSKYPVTVDCGLFICVFMASLS